MNPEIQTFLQSARAGRWRTASDADAACDNELRHLRDTIARIVTKYDTMTPAQRTGFEELRARVLDPATREEYAALIAKELCGD